MTDAGHPSVVVMMTCHNRKESTVACLESLAVQVGVEIKVVLNDDGSIDGTWEAVAGYPFVFPIRGSGMDFWAGGMRRAWSVAKEIKADAHLLLNDDVFLEPGSVLGLYRWFLTNPVGLWGGSVRDSITGAVNYGGYSSGGRLRRMRLRLIEPTTSPQLVDVLNGNFLMISADTLAFLGGLSPEFTHGMADFDLSWRAWRHGIPSVLAPGAWGLCRSNAREGSWRDINQPRSIRWRRLMQPTGLPPTEYLKVCLRHGGPAWFIDFLSPYVRVLIGK